MLGLTSFINTIKKKKSLLFIYYEILIVFFFAGAYWVADRIIFYLPDLAKKLHFGTIKEMDTFYSYLYFSLITQTTVGFGGTLPDGNNVVTTQSELMKILSLMQMFSIVIITGWTLSD